VMLIVVSTICHARLIGLLVVAFLCDASL